MKYELKKPIKVGDGPEITSLVFREEICAGDMRGIPVRDPMYFDDLLKLAGRLCAQPDVVINKMAIKDTGEVIQIVMGFLDAGPEIGKTPSES